jgi:prephenate dehydratase
MRIGYLGPEGTFSEEAIRAAGAAEGRALVAIGSVHDTVMAVQRGQVERALVPLENSLEGSVNATLDALAVDALDVRIVGELVHPVRHCLIAREALALGDIEEIRSHPQASAQCARLLRGKLAHARLLLTSSTAEAVRTVARAGGPRAALGTRLAADLYGCRVLRSGVEDVAGNETRFGWIAPEGDAPAGDARMRWKTSLVFWGVGADAPGWLVRCLSEFAFRGVNLVRIESRPRRQGLGRYMFFIDLEGRDSDAPVASAIRALRDSAEVVRTLGSYPSA